VLKQRTLKLIFLFYFYLSNNTNKMEARQLQKTNNSQLPLRPRKINIFTNGAKSILTYKFHIYYDLLKSTLVVNLQMLKKVYKSESFIKLKVYIWYTLTVTWDELDGLRIYINNRMLDHNFGLNTSITEKEEGIYFILLWHCE
jgi:hypothetical protein